MIVGLPELKMHLRLDGNADDAIVEALAMAAEELVRHWLGRPIYQAVDVLPAPGTPLYHPDQVVASAAVRVAIMMLVARMYDDERAGGGGLSDPASLPASVRALLAGERVFAPSEVPDEGA